MGKIAKSFNDEFTKIEINVATSPNSTSSSNQFKNRLKRLRDNLESNELSRQTTIIDYLVVAKLNTGASTGENLPRPHPK